MDFDIKTRIIGKAMEGRWEPDRAERVAARLGAGPIATEPDATLFNPMDLTAWTLPMVISWICRRDLERVRRCRDDYRLGRWEWRKFRSRRPIDGGREWQLVEGWELVSPERVSLSRLMLEEALSEAASEPVLMSVKSAREALWRALGEGHLVASAIKEEIGKPAQVIG